MSLQTVEVELENGIVRPCSGETLPPKARALLTIMKSAESEEPKPGRSLGDALRELDVTSLGKYTDLSTNKAHLDDLGK